MTRILITLAAVGTLAVLPMSRPAADGAPETGLATTSVDDGMITRRVFEGPRVDFWGVGVSPDGRYATQRVDGHLAVLDLVTGVERVVPSTHGFVGTAAFSHDQQQIAYMVWDGQYAIRVVNVDGSDNRLLFQGIPRGEPAEFGEDIEAWPEVYGWAADDSAVLAIVYGDGGTHIALLPLDGSPRQVLYRPEKRKGSSFAAISPDGKWLAFDQNVEAPTPEQPLPDVDIYVAPMDGSTRPVAVAPHRGHDQLIGWAEDGRILLSSDRDLTEGVWAVTMSGGRPAGEPTLVKGDLWGLRPIAVVGSTVFYGVATQHQQVHTIGLSMERGRLEGALTPVEPDVRPSLWPTWSPDGRHLAYLAIESFTSRSTREYEKGVIRSAAGHEAQEVDLEPVTSTSRHLRWVVDGEIYVRGKAVAEDGQRSWSALDLETGEARTLFTLDRAPYCSIPAFHPDGRRMFCARRYEEEGRTELLEVNLSDLGSRVIWELEDGPSRSRQFEFPTLSPDASQLAFWEVAEEGTSDPAEDLVGNVTKNLTIVPVTGGAPRTVFSVTGQADGQYYDCVGRRTALWGPDGKNLLVTVQQRRTESDPEEACALYAVPVSGGAAVRVGALPEFYNNWALSPDGTRLAVVAGESRGEIWVLEEEPSPRITY